MPQKRGKFIVFEGIDGCGKTTQAWLLADKILNLNKYFHLLLTREPYKEVEIRQILKQDNNPYSQAEKLAELFITDRKKHVQEIILPNLELGVHIVSDRYKLSTLAYQSVQGIDFNKLLQMHSGLPVPDITFFIDVSVEVAIQRMKKDSRNEQKFEKSLEFLEKLRQRYLEMPKLLNENIIIIDGNRDIETIHKEIMKHVEKLLALGK